jgi:predicted peroxiredoxin
MNEEPKTLLINLISSEGSNAGKALRIGQKFLAVDWQVVLSLNIEAVKLLDSSIGEQLCPVAGKPLMRLLEAFQSEGGQVLVGTECLALAGMDPDCLLPGMELAKFPVMEKILSRPGIRTMTW